MWAKKNKKAYHRTMRFTPLTSFVFFLIKERTAVVEATYTIAATDSVTRQIGAAGGTCVEGNSLYEINYHGVPNHGVLLTQALPPSPESPVYDLGEALLLNGTDPASLSKKLQILYWTKIMSYWLNS